MKKKKKKKKTHKKHTKKTHTHNKKHDPQVGDISEFLGRDTVYTSHVLVSWKQTSHPDLPTCFSKHSFLP